MLSCYHRAVRVSSDGAITKLLINTMDRGNAFTVCTWYVCATTFMNFSYRNGTTEVDLSERRTLVVNQRPKQTLLTKEHKYIEMTYGVLNHSL
jgi:hypothetical protein